MMSRDFDAEFGDLHIASSPASNPATNPASAAAFGVPGVAMSGQAADLAVLAIAGPGREIVFIEDDVAGYQTIAANAGAGRRVVILDAGKDGLQQIADVLHGLRGIDAVHVVTHGAEGRIALGALTLDASTLAAHRDVLAAIGSSLAPGGDLLLYGCSVGAGRGADLLGQLAIATGADVAASGNPTGDASLGGDWALEVTSGSVGTASFASPALAAGFHDLLSITTPTTINFSAAPFSPGYQGPNADLAYALPGHPGYTLKFDGHGQGVGSYGAGYITFSPYMVEDKITIGFSGNQVFTPTSVKVNGNASNAQTLLFTGLNADGSEVTHTNVAIPQGATINDFVTRALGGFTNIKTLVITPQAGSSIQYFQMDDLVIANVQPPAPQVSSVTSPAADGAYTAGRQIDIQVNFDSAVDVTGTPQLTLETGATDRVIDYLSGSGSATLTFRYTVQAGDTTADLDYLGTALALNGGTIRLAGSTADATLTLPTPGTAGSLGANKAIVIDTTAPNAPSAPDLGAASDSGSSGSDNLTNKTTGLVFTGSAEAGVSAVKLYDSDGVTEIAATSALGGGAYTITTTGTLAGGAHTLSVKAFDAAGNASAASGSLALTLDTTAPAVSVASSQSVLKAGESALITFTFSEDPGASFTAADVAYSGGTLGAIVGSGLVRTAVFTPSANVNNGSAGIGVNAQSYADAAGNAGSGATGMAISYDTLAPTLTIATSKPSLMAGETATIIFSFSEDPGASFAWDGGSGDIVVSGGTLSALVGSGLTRSATFTPAANVDGGTASISVPGAGYTDAQDNHGSDASLGLTFDTLAPGAPSAPVLDPDDDSGSSHTDNVTSAGTLHLGGSAAAGSTVRLYDSDGATEIGHGSADGSGNWAIATDAPLAEGAHMLTARAFDAAGNAGAASAALPVLIDRTAPATGIGSVRLSADSGSSDSDMITAIAAQTISGSLGANLAAGEQVMVSLDDGATWAPASAAAGTNTWQLAATLAASGVLRVQVVDAAGNTGAPYAHAYVLDTVAPSAPSTPDLDTASDSGSSHTDDITGNTRPAFSGSAETGAIVRLYDGATLIGEDLAVDGSWHIASTTDLAAGSHAISAEATDLAGNVSAASAALAVQVLDGGPSTGIATLALSDDSGTPGDFITNQEVQTVSGRLGAALGAGERVQFSLDGGAHWSDAASVPGNDAWSFPATLTAGTHELRVRVLDAVDNPGPVHIQAYTLDQVGPGVVIASDSAALRAGETATITFTFSEDPGASFAWDGSSGDLAVSGGTLSAVLGTGLVRSAIFTPDAGVDAGSAGIGIAAGSYADAAGNGGTAGALPTLSFDTLAPGAPPAPALDQGSDSGASSSDGLTRETVLVFTGSAEAGTTVRLYDSDGSTEVGHATATGGGWTITTVALAQGSHTVTARAFDAAGNASAASAALTVTVDTTPPDALAAPVLAGASDSGTAGDGITRVAAPVFGGTAEALAQVMLYDGSSLIGGIIGTAQADATGAWQITASSLPDGVHTITARQTDLAGNTSAAGAAFALTVDSVAPAAPGAPALAAASDSGNIGDGITSNSLPVIEGNALANALVTLYDGAGPDQRKLGMAVADGAGKWSIQGAALAQGTHLLSATQQDAAGNESAASAAFQLRIDAPPTPPANLIDGVVVDVQPVSFPGGILGSAVSIPIVMPGRMESNGDPRVADIPLASNAQGATLLLAQVAVGYGLTASGANAPVADAAGLLLAAIRAATPAHAAADQGHLTGNAGDFLARLAADGTLLVETVKPVSALKVPDVLTLSGAAPGSGHSTTLVIDTAGLVQGDTIALQRIDFAAVVGAATVVARSSMVLTGDAASQHFTLEAGGAGALFAGGGSDTLTFAPIAGQGAVTGTTLLHGGLAADVAVFSGARADYQLALHNGYVVVSSAATPALEAMVVNVEQLRFSDASVTVQNSAEMGTLAGIYQTLLGRQADVLGIEFWADVRQAGASWGRIALDMAGSSEHAASHQGFNGVAAHDIALLYAAIFDRGADAAGLAYWTDAMAHGASLEQVASAFVQGAEMVGHQRAAPDWDFSV